MQISSRFTIAVHTLLCIAYFAENLKVTSSFIASSVNVNPVVIRRILGQLKEAGIVTVDAGVGGAHLARSADAVSLLDIYRAVECVNGSLFSFHSDPNPSCPVGGNVHAVLDGEISAAQEAMERRLSETTLGQLLDGVRDLAARGGDGVRS